MLSAIVGIYAIVTACQVRHITLPSGLPCGISPAPVFNFTITDKNGANLLMAKKQLRFFVLTGNQRAYLDQQWDIKSFSSDSTQRYVVAKTIQGFAQSSTSFYIETVAGSIHQVNVTIGNNPQDPQCPNSYFYTKVTVDGQDETALGEVKDAVPYYKLHL